MHDKDYTVANNLQKHLDKWRKESRSHTQTKLADKLKVDPSLLSQWLSKKRPIPENKYPAIAAALNINIEDLLRPQEEPSVETAYVLVSYRGRESGRAITFLKHVHALDTENIVQEVATVYGNKGGLLKLQAPTQYEIAELLRKISPYCDSTNTMFVMSGYHWQRQQDEDFRVLKKIDQEHYLLGDLISKVEEIKHWIAEYPGEDALTDYLDDFFQDSGLMNALEGKLHICDPEKLLKYPLLLAKNVRSNLYGLVVWDQRTPREKEKYENYLDEQIKLLKTNKGVQIQRVFVTRELPPPDDLLQEMQRQHRAGIEVYYLPYEKWQAARAQVNKPLDFGLFDDTHLWIHDELVDTNELRTATLYTPRNNSEKITRYKRLFEANRAASQRFDEQ